MDDKTIEDYIAENAVLIAENARLKRRVRELEHVKQLDQAEIIGLRRQIEILTEYIDRDYLRRVQAQRHIFTRLHRSHIPVEMLIYSIWRRLSKLVLRTRQKEGGKLMYDELLKRLRERCVFLFPHHGESRSYDADLMHQAADAIEKLQKAVLRAEEGET